MILACCMSPARSAAEARRRMLETANRMLGIVIAAITRATNTTITSSTRLNPPMRSCRVPNTLLWSFIVATASFLRFCAGEPGLLYGTEAPPTGGRRHLQDLFQRLNKPFQQ